MAFWDDFLEEKEVKTKTEGETKIIEGAPKEAFKEVKVKFPGTKKRKQAPLTGDKTMNKEEMIAWFMMFLKEKKAVFTLDWLRGQKLTFESVSMRKNT